MVLIRLKLLWALGEWVFHLFGKNDDEIKRLFPLDITHGSYILLNIWEGQIIQKEKCPKCRNGCRTCDKGYILKVDKRIRCGNSEEWNLLGFLYDNNYDLISATKDKLIFQKKKESI